MTSLTRSELHGNLIPEIHVNSKLFNPKRDQPNARMNDLRFLQDLKYQYLQKADEEKKKFR